MARRAGFDVYCIDWGTPGDEDRYLTFDEICDGYLGRAVRPRPRGAAGAQKVHLLGYCMGGILATIHAAVRPSHVASLATLAAPVRFDGAGLRRLVDPLADLRRALARGRLRQRAVDAPAERVPHAPADARRSPRWSHLLDRAWDDESLDGFLAIEAWGNDNVCDARRRLSAVHRGPLPARHARARRVHALRAPGAPRRDHVPDARHDVRARQHRSLEGRQGARRRVSSNDKEWLHLPGGHVGAVVSKSASQKLWPKLAAFWEERDGAVKEAPAKKGRSSKSSRAPAPNTTLQSGR